MLGPIWLCTVVWSLFKPHCLEEKPHEIWHAFSGEHFLLGASDLSHSEFGIIIERF